MSRISINLSPKYRLDVSIVKARKKGTAGEPLIPTINKLRRVRNGSKFSRIFRYFFQHSSLKRILGSQLAVAMLVSSFVPTAGKAARLSEVEISEEIAVIKTQRSLNPPVQKTIINQNYHMFHQGIDFEGYTGEPVYSISAGTVTETGYSKYGYGNTVYIDHENGLSSLYAHLSHIDVDRGDRVVAGQKIGEVGSTGRSTGDHLHLEVKLNGQNINPMSLLP